MGADVEKARGRAEAARVLLASTADPPSSREPEWFEVKKALIDDLAARLPQT